LTFQSFDLEHTRWIISGITFIMYAQYRNIGKPNNLKVFGSNKPNGQNRIAKIGQCYLCMSEENLRKWEVWRFKIWFNPPFLKKCLYQVRDITVFTVFRLLTDFVCLYTYEFWLSLCTIVGSSVILLLPLFVNNYNVVILYYY
jgi:hypothetical protein